MHAYLTGSVQRDPHTAGKSYVPQRYKEVDGIRAVGIFNRLESLSRTYQHFGEILPHFYFCFAPLTGGTNNSISTAQNRFSRHPISTEDTGSADKP